METCQFSVIGTVTQYIIIGAAFLWKSNLFFALYKNLERRWNFPWLPDQLKPGLEKKKEIIFHRTTKNRLNKVAGLDLSWS